MLFIGVVAVWLILDLRSHGRHLKRMAASRKPMSRADFLGEMARQGISQRSAADAWEFAIFYYPKFLAPYPEDRAVSDLRIDPEDIEDIAAEWWVLRGWKRPSPSDPVVIPLDPSLSELAAWLDSKRGVN